MERFMQMPLPTEQQMVSKARSGMTVFCWDRLSGNRLIPWKDYAGLQLHQAYTGVSSYTGPGSHRWTERVRTGIQLNRKERCRAVGHSNKARSQEHLFPKLPAGEAVGDHLTPTVLPCLLYKVTVVRLHCCHHSEYLLNWAFHQDSRKVNLE